MKTEKRLLEIRGGSPAKDFGLYSNSNWQIAKSHFT